MQAASHGDRRTPVDGTRAPFGINLAVGSTLMVGTTMITAAFFPGADPTARLVAVCAVVGGHAATVADAPASLVTAGLGYLLFTGFLVNRYGDLTWDGTTSAWLLAVLSLWSVWGLDSGGSATPEPASPSTTSSATWSSITGR